MTNKIANPSYDQLPHIVKNHPETNPEHWALMICIFKILKDKSQCIYSNEKLSIDCRISLRTTERRIAELKTMGFLSTIGRSYNRRFKLGLLFNTTASMAVNSDKYLDTTAKNAILTAKIDISNRHSGGYTKITNNISNKDKDYFYKPEQHELQDIKKFIENNWQIPKELTEAYRWYLENIVVK